MTGLRTLVVDDEPLARARLLQLLEFEEDVDVLAACADGEEAVAAIELYRPDLVFLDIRMPRLGGFEVLEALEPEALPAVVFVTAYDEYAIPAFEIHATDYLLKPVSRERFGEALALSSRPRRSSARMNCHCESSNSGALASATEIAWVCR